AGRGAGGRAAGGGLADAGPAAAVEADAEQQLARRDALALQLLDRGVGVEPGGRDPAVGGERRVRGGRALRGEGAEVVVGHDVVPVDVLGGARVVGGVDLAAVGAVGRDGGGHQVA